MQANEEQSLQSRMINVRNKAFWNGVAARNRQIETLPLMERIFSVDREDLRLEFIREQSAKGGRAKKGDALTVAIRQILTQAPTISEAELRQKLRNFPDIDFLDDRDHNTNCGIATQIRFLNRRGSEEEIPISALKYRILRAKKFIAQTGLRK
jgi:hypothetical protein